MTIATSSNLVSVPFPWRCPSTRDRKEISEDLSFPFKSSLYFFRIVEKVKKLGLAVGPQHLKIKEVKYSLDEMTHEQEERKKPKKGKKRKANEEDSKAAVPESDLVTPQKDETNTLPDTGRAKKKVKTKKKSKAESSGEVNTSQRQEPSGAEDENGSDGEKDLSPEEKRVLERKMKKILKKEEKKKLKEESKSIEKNQVQSNLAEKKALEYLTCWSERREEWKFYKSRQIWLLQHMYDTTKVSDDHFKVLLAYLEGLRGAARGITLQKAEAILRWEGQGEEEDTADAKKKKQRAKEVVQLL